MPADNDDPRPEEHQPEYHYHNDTPDADILAKLPTDVDYIALTVDFTAAMLKRIVLERGDEAVATWIREAVAKRLQERREGRLPAVPRPAYEYPTDLDDRQLLPIGRVEREFVQVRLELPAPWLQAVDERRDECSFADWIRGAVEYRFLDIDSELPMVRGELRVKFPPERMARWLLEHEHYRTRGINNVFDDTVIDNVTSDVTWLVGGEPVDEDTRPEDLVDDWT